MTGETTEETMLRDPGPPQIEQPPAVAARPSTRCTIMQLNYCGETVAAGAYCTAH